MGRGDKAAVRRNGTALIGTMIRAEDCIEAS
jgi:hypothetical protein